MGAALSRCSRAKLSVSGGVLFAVDTILVSPLDAAAQPRRQQRGHPPHRKVAQDLSRISSLRIPWLSFCRFPSASGSAEDFASWMPSQPHSSNEQRVPFPFTRISACQGRSRCRVQSESKIDKQQKTQVFGVLLENAPFEILYKMNTKIHEACCLEFLFRPRCCGSRQPWLPKGHCPDAMLGTEMMPIRMVGSSRVAATRTSKDPTTKVF